MKKLIKKHQTGAAINSNILKPSTLTEEQLSSRIKDWRQSPEWHAQATGRVEAPPIDPIDLVAFGGVPKLALSELFGAIAARNAYKLAATKALPNFARASTGRLTTINLTHPKTVQAATGALGKYNKLAGQVAGGLTANIWDAAGDNVDYSKKLVKK